ncbi:holo-ACP synthase [Hydrogenophilus thermoluteolus]|uniref:holo-ACP synthase n=1 Tax=Hydrogenophilus thermoluteolus TaxID=297 RepID=UPI003F678903
MQRNATVSAPVTSLRAMILGIGVDLVAVARVEQVWGRHRDRLACRILQPTEQEVFFTRLAACAPLERDRFAVRFLAKRFAAKEAFAKAWGSGIGAEVRFHDIAITHQPSGQPVWRFSASFAQRFADRGATAAHLSLSDEETHVVAFVVIEGGTRV